MQYQPREHLPHDQTLTDLMNLRNLLTPRYRWNKLSFADNDSYCLVGGVWKIAIGQGGREEGLRVRDVLFNKRSGRMVDEIYATGIVRKGIVRELRAWHKPFLALLTAAILWAVPKMWRISAWNDSVLTNHADVLACIDCAIDRRLRRNKVAQLIFA
jgi:hypothetical protein